MNAKQCRNSDIASIVRKRDYSFGPRVQTQLSHQETRAIRPMAVREVLADLSYRVARRRASFRRHNMRSIVLR